jgi:hypothetical protein
VLNFIELYDFLIHGAHFTANKGQFKLASNLVTDALP